MIRKNALSLFKIQKTVMLKNICYVYEILKIFLLVVIMLVILQYINISTNFFLGLLQNISMASFFLKIQDYIAVERFSPNSEYSFLYSIHLNFIERITIFPFKIK
jgi:hypothetical protein